jgi:DNA topoisomerase-2
MHKEHNMYVPEMVFGHLLTSDNYDDNEKKTTGGRNGYGAKLTNIFSTKFQIECADPGAGLKYAQSWEKNMQKSGKAKITKHSGKNGYTSVTFEPDLQRFGMKSLDTDIIALMTKRVMDLAGVTGKKCKVFLNGEQLPVKEFKDYVNLFTDSDVAFDRCGDRWEVACSISDGQFQSLSFVNSICTTKGGTHVTHVTDQFVEAIMKKVNAKRKGGMEIRPFQIKNHLSVFVNCLIENPSFDSQTKETMTLKQSKFGSKYELSDGMVTKILNTGIVDIVLSWAKAKEDIDLDKKIGGSSSEKRQKRLTGVPKLEDANLAGTGRGKECTLILTEGDSAKSLAVAGLSVVGRDRFGVFPLRGKPLNIREASFTQTMNNAEVHNIIKIMGLQPKKDYKTVKDFESLRYGSIMIMADQDYDGSHIKGLLINIIQHWWPTLYKREGFVKEFVTPIVKVSKGAESHQFFTMREYDQWKQKTPNAKSWHVKYYKGLGTSTTAEAKEYFKKIDSHSLTFDFEGEKDDECVDLAFNKKRADDRKEWINACDEDSNVDHSSDSVSYSDFVYKELVHYAKYDVMRSIPSIADGFKPSQRKVMFCSFKRNMKADVKVAQLAGYVSEHSAYHHGEVSLQGTIVGLAQNFVGSNNVNLLTPSGQFGTRLTGGKDAASARYIYTRLEATTRMIFHPDDDLIVQQQQEEGQKIEPKYFVPVIPMVLVNGADGIGIGWSTFIPNYNPREIIANLKRYLRCQPMHEMCPWYAGFKGSILPSDSRQGYDVVGVVDKVDSTTLEISELPLRKWTQDYKEFLQGLLGDGDKPGKIQDFKEYHTERAVHFVVKVTEVQMQSLEKEGFDKAFKLRTTMALTNMFLFNHEGKITKYENEKEILEEFAQLRLATYKKRKAYLVAKLRRESALLSAKARFIRMVISGKLEIKKRKKDAIISDLKKHGFNTLWDLYVATSEEDVDMGDDDGGEGAAAAAEEALSSISKTGRGERGYDYLLGMALWSLTLERVEDAEQKMREKAAEVERLRLVAVEEFWEKELNSILDALDRTDGEMLEQEREGDRLKTRARRQEQQAKLAPKRGMSKWALTTPSSAAAPPSGTSYNWLQALQERHLSKTNNAFPGLFDDVQGGGVGKRPAEAVAVESAPQAKLPRTMA